MSRRNHRTGAENEESDTGKVKSDYWSFGTEGDTACFAEHVHGESNRLVWIQGRRGNAKEEPKWRESARN